MVLVFVIHLHSCEVLVALLFDVSARNALLVWVVVRHCSVDLGRQDGTVPLSAQFQSFPRVPSLIPWENTFAVPTKMIPMCRAVAKIR